MYRPVHLSPMNQDISVHEPEMSYLTLLNCPALARIARHIDGVWLQGAELFVWVEEHLPSL